MDNNLHVPVLLSECITNLNIKPNGVYLDGTLGMGGHSMEIVKRLGDNGKLICIDKDTYAIEKSQERLKAYSDKIIYVHDDFRNCSNIIDKLGFDSVNGMLFDLGVSSPQLDEADRGFSYMQDSPLDMRMNKDNNLTAYNVVNEYSEDKITNILFEYGEEKFAKKIAREICTQREISDIKTTFELVNIIKSSLPSSALREKQHPAKRTFQAIRIEVNDELGAVSEMMDTAPDKLCSGGRLCVISFHSLEDRIVKNKIRSKENGCTCPKEYPICVCGFVQTLRSVSKKPFIPSDTEIENNPRARSAKLRVAEKI